MFCIARSSVVFAGLLWSSLALAQSQKELDEAAQLARSAIVDYEAERFDRAAAAFLRAYEITKVPVQLRNAAKSYEAAGELGTAKSLWERYRDLEEVDAKQRVYANARIASIEAELAPPPPPPPPPPEVAPPPPAIVAPPPPPPEEGRSYTGTFVAAAGAIVAIVGVVFVVSGAGAQSDLEDRTSQLDARGLIVGTSYREYLDDQSAINRDYGIGGGLITLGAIGVGTGLALQLID